MDSHVSEDELKAIVAQSLGIPATEVTDALEYSLIPQWDSMAHISLMTALEARFGVTIEDDLVVDLTSYDRIRDFILGRAT